MDPCHSSYRPSSPDSSTVCFSWTGLYGDTKYNPKFQKTKKKYTEIGLYSTRISFNHPVTGERMTFKIEPSGEAFEKMDVEAF